MKQRIISGLAGVVLLIVILALGTPYVQLAVLLLSAMAVYELFHAVRLSDMKNLTITAVVATVVISVAQFIDRSLFMPALYVWLVVLFVFYMINRENTELKDVAIAFMLTVYVTFMFGHLVHIYVMDKGFLLIWAVLVAAFLTDTFAMFGGVLFGKHKLCPVLSPKKTIEGSICGIVGCIISILVYCIICNRFFDVQVDYINALVVGLGASIISQIGDLAASCIKRQFGVKDYGNIMPGHGGVMDRFDSVLFVAPFIYYMLWIFPIFR